jgi:hypothetical protein
VFRGGKTETIIKDLIFVQSFGITSCNYYGMQLQDSVKTKNPSDWLLMSACVWPVKAARHSADAAAKKTQAVQHLAAAR